MLRNKILYAGLSLSLAAPYFVNHAHAGTIHTTKVALSDSAVTAKIKLLYAQSPEVKDSQLHVSTVNHIVILSGQVPTRTQYERAIVLADSIKGVHGVNVDNLKVKSSDAPLKDTYITAKVKAIFLKEKIFGSKGIEFWPVKVETKDATVYLSGHVTSKKQKINLQNLAKKIDDVKLVENAIFVE